MRRAGRDSSLTQRGVGTLRIVVGCTVVTLALGTLGCSNTTEPGATRRGIEHQPVSGTPIPVAQGVHVTPLPEFDNGKLTPGAFNDLDEIAGDTGGFTVFRWSQTGGLHILPVPDTGFFGGFAKGINRRRHGRW
jgi:hypothetical protein